MSVARQERDFRARCRGLVPRRRIATAYRHAARYMLQRRKPADELALAVAFDSGQADDLAAPQIERHALDTAGRELAQLHVRSAFRRPRMAASPGNRTRGHDR